MSRASRQALTLLGVAAGSIKMVLHAVQDTELSQRADQANEKLIQLVIKYPATGSNSSNIEWVNKKLLGWDDMLTQIQGIEWRLPLCVSIAYQALIDLDAKIGRKEVKVMLDDVIQDVAWISDWFDERGKNIPMFEETEKYLTMLYDSIGFEV